MKEKKKCIISIILLLAVQAILYYVSKSFQGTPHLIGSNFDKAFPFNKYFVYIYDSWYPFLLITWYLLFMKDKNNYKNFYITSVLTMIIANIIFLIYPTTIERATFEVNDLASFILNFTYVMDYPINCFPSMHCMFCFTTMFYYIISNKISYKLKIPVFIYSILIILSTMFIKQHVLYDMIGSLIISIICFFICKLKFFDKYKKYFD